MTKTPVKRVIDRIRLQELIQLELDKFRNRTEKSNSMFTDSQKVLLGGVPMSWMNKWVGGYPIFFQTASGATITDVDGNVYDDFCLGDSGAMAGHSNQSTVTAISERIGITGGITTMLPTSDAALVGENLSRRFGMARWQFTLSATDANRFALRLVRQITQRPKILVFSYCYHGTVDETFVTLSPTGPTSRYGNVGPSVDPTQTTVVAEFNDLSAVELLLAKGDVAAVLMEPALTNIGIVLPEPGFLNKLTEVVHSAGSLLIVDETHTFSAGFSGCTGLYGLQPDLITIGKSLAGGVPFGAYGVSDEVASKIYAQSDADYIDTGGIGGTLAGNALSLAAARATLTEVFTEDNFDHMIELADRYTDGINAVIEEFSLPWNIVSLGARAEYRFCENPPKTGGESAKASDEDLDVYMHLYMLNRGILLTPFHNMALMSPLTTAYQVDRHCEIFRDAVMALTS